MILEKLQMETVENEPACETEQKLTLVSPCESLHSHIWDSGGRSVSNIEEYDNLKLILKLNKSTGGGLTVRQGQSAFIMLL